MLKVSGDFPYVSTMFEFDLNQQQLLTRDQAMILKLTLPHFNNSYYENSFRDGWCNHNGTMNRRNHNFIGYLVETYKNIGFSLDNQSFVAVHKFEQNWDWTFDNRHFEREPYYWFLMFQGCDDISYYCVFDTEARLDKYFSEIIQFENTAGMSVLN